MKGQLLAQHFAVNSGEKYKYNVETLSLAFEESPKCVMQAFDLCVSLLHGRSNLTETGRITRQVQTVLQETVKFNEILSVFYREGQKMNWHDDGEDGRYCPHCASLRRLSSS